MVLPTIDDPNPHITRIINTFLLYAIRDKATEIRIKHLIEDGFKCVVYVLHDDGKPLHELPLPDACFQPLRERLWEIAGEEALIDVKLGAESYPFAIFYQREIDASLAAEFETVILKLQEKSSPHS